MKDELKKIYPGFIILTRINYELYDENNNKVSDLKIISNKNLIIIDGNSYIVYKQK